MEYAQLNTAPLKKTSIFLTATNQCVRSKQGQNNKQAKNKSKSKVNSRHCSFIVLFWFRWKMYRWPIPFHNVTCRWLEKSHTHIGMNIDWYSTNGLPCIISNIIIGDVTGQTLIGTSTRNDKATSQRSYGRCGMSTSEWHILTLDPGIGCGNILIHGSDIAPQLIIPNLSTKDIMSLFAATIHDCDRIHMIRQERNVGLGHPTRHCWPAVVYCSFVTNWKKKKLGNVSEMQSIQLSHLVILDVASCAHLLEE
jgi:hypothetical protein